MIDPITRTHRKNLLHLVCDRTVEQSTENLLPILRTLIQRGCNMNQRDDCAETPLMCTLHHGGNIALGISYFCRSFERVLMPFFVPSSTRIDCRRYSIGFEE